MRDIRRWAIYFAPKRNCALGRFGADWLGWDAEAGLPRPGLEVAGVPRERLVARARKYGFHATLKAPFPLAEGCEPVELDRAVTEVAASFRRFETRLRLGELGAFLALMIDGPCPEMEALAAACVTRLDRFRGAADRSEAGLSAAQRALAREWGYPFVLGEFRFHMTLTGPMEADERAAVAAAMEARLAPILAEPVPVGDICLFGEDQAGMFHLLKRFQLGERG